MEIRAKNVRAKSGHFVGRDKGVEEGAKRTNRKARTKHTGEIVEHLACVPR